MALTSDLLARLREACGDTPGNSVDDALGVALLNLAQDELASTLEIFTMHDGLSIVKDSPFVDLPADLVRVRSLRYFNYTEPITAYQEADLEKNPIFFSPDQSGTPLRAVFEQKPGANNIRVILHPTPDTADPSSTVAVANMLVGDTEVNVTSAANFRAPGIAKSENEKFLFLSVDSTNNKLQKITRGYSKTTAAQHNIGIPVTQMGLELRYARVLTAFDSAALGATAEWPDRHRMTLVHYAASLYFQAAENPEKAKEQMVLAGLGEGFVRDDFWKKHRHYNPVVGTYKRRVADGRLPYFRGGTV